jgi:hypothetical protein
MADQSKPTVRLNYHPYASKGEAAIQIRRFMISAYGTDGISRGVVFQDMAGNAEVLFPPIYDDQDLGRIVIIQSHGPVPPPPKPLASVVLGKAESIDHMLNRLIDAQLDFSTPQSTVWSVMKLTNPMLMTASITWDALHDLIVKHPVLFDTVAIGLDVFGVVSEGILTLGLGAVTLGATATGVFAPGAALTGWAAAFTATGFVASSLLTYADVRDLYYLETSDDATVQKWEHSRQHLAIETAAPIAAILDPLREGMNVARAGRAIPGETKTFIDSEKALKFTEFDKANTDKFVAGSNDRAGGTASPQRTALIEKIKAKKAGAVETAANKVKAAGEKLKDSQADIANYFATDRFGLSNYRTAVASNTASTVQYILNPPPISSVFGQYIPLLAPDNARA